MLDRVRPRRKAERLIDDLRRSVPFFSADEVRHLMSTLADLLEEIGMEKTNAPRTRRKRVTGAGGPSTLTCDGGDDEQEDG